MAPLLLKELGAIRWEMAIPETSGAWHRSSLEPGKNDVVSITLDRAIAHVGLTGMRP
jgi:hypothetical protein